MRKVTALLGNAPEILSDVNGKLKLDFVPSAQGKVYTFYTSLNVQPLDLVVCQVKNSFCFGLVQFVDENEITEEEFLKRSITSGMKQIVGIVELPLLERQTMFTRVYQKRLREIELENSINRNAFEDALAALATNVLPEA